MTCAASWPLSRLALWKATCILIKQGRLTLRTGDTSAYLIEQPSLVFMARSQPHQLRAQVEAGTQVVCASILYGVGSNNPLANAFPPVLVLPLDEDPRLAFVCTWLFDEAFAELEGRQLAINRLGNCWCCRCCVTWWSAPATHRACWQALLTLSCTRPCWPYTETRRGLEPGGIGEPGRYVAQQIRRTVQGCIGPAAGDYLIEWRLGWPRVCCASSNPSAWWPMRWAMKTPRYWRACSAKNRPDAVGMAGAAAELA